MKKAISLAFLFFILFGCQAQPITLHTYDDRFLTYPDDFPNDQPIVLAFLNVNDRTCDQAILPLRALSTRDSVYLAGVMTYTNDSFLTQITTQREIVFPVMLDPKRKMFDRFGVDPSRCPAFVYLSPNGDVVDREYDIAKIKDWYKPVWIDKALNRRHRVTPEEKVEE